VQERAEARGGRGAKSEQGRRRCEEHSLGASCVLAPQRRETRQRRVRTQLMAHACSGGEGGGKGGRGALRRGI
jgi:hypothetical protein